jgi:predicted phosphodiesterase
MSSPRRLLVLPDIHVPDHDVSALSIVKDFARDWKPHDVVQLGDIINADQVSEYPNDCSTPLKREFKIARGILDDFKVTHFLQGNHCQRLTRVGLVKRTLRSMLDPVRNLGLNKRGIYHRPYHSERGIFKFGKLSVVHGFFCGENAALQHSRAYGCVAFGHVHRRMIQQPKAAGTHATGYGLGCLCRLDLPYMDGKPPHGWSQGFGFFYVFKSGHFSPYMASIIGNEVCIEGKVYRR